MIDLTALEGFRIKDPASYRYGEPGCSIGGAFLVPGRGNNKICVIASSGDGWDHVSVSLQHRTPTWDEMDMVKRLFFKADEVAMQLHVATSEHINIHCYCLHLWRPHSASIPLPPKELV